MESWNFFFSDETSTSSPAFGISEILRASLISPDSSSLSFADDDQSASRAFDSNNNNNRESSSLIALNLGTAVDRRRLSQVRSPSSSSSTATKRARTSRGRYSQTTPFCQVLGCNMDLSGSKEYHKKHRVCDVHSKSPKVVVNGIEQRFCQQCSRFHLLGEFDDGKRSCRRRLAGHNERRRKPPQFEQGLSNKPHKFFSHSFQDSRYLGASQQKRTPFVFSDILPEANLSPEKHEHVSRIGEIKFEADPDFRLHHLTSPVTHSLEKHHRAFGIPSPESQDYYFGSAAMFHKPLGASFDPPCALSLLSSQPQETSSHFATGTAFVPQISRARQVERHGPYGNFHSSPGTDVLAEPLAFPNSSHVPAAEFGVVSDRAFHGSNYGSTVDLLQLSTHLHRVEHQRNFMQLKQENDEFCCFPNA